MRNILLLVICCLTFSSASAETTNAAASTYHFTSAQDAERFSALTNETRCVVCQFQNIADSNAPLAASLRDKIYQMITDKKSDDEIKSYLVKRYGEVILLKPRFNPLTAVLWLFPALALLLFGFIMFRFYRQAK